MNVIEGFIKKYLIRHMSILIGELSMFLYMILKGLT